jgi:hypothetical protein
MIEFDLDLEKLDLTGEKEGWICALIKHELAEQINPGKKTSFRIKGSLDDLAISQKALLPIGEGDFVLPFNMHMRKTLRKDVGDKIHFKVELDSSEFQFSEDFLMCLEDDPQAMEEYSKLTPSHRKYYSNWIESAKTIETKTKRINQAIFGLANQMDYGAMIRHFKGK